MLLWVGYCWSISSFHGSIIRKHLLRLLREYWLYWPTLIVAYKGGLRGCAGLLRSGMVCRKPGVSGWGERSRSHQGTKMVDLHVIFPKTETSENYLDTLLHNLTPNVLESPSAPINHWQCSEVTSHCANLKVRSRLSTTNCIFSLITFKLAMRTRQRWEHPSRPFEFIENNMWTFSLTAWDTTSYCAQPHAARPARVTSDMYLI